MTAPGAELLPQQQFPRRRVVRPPAARRQPSWYREKPAVAYLYVMWFVCLTDPHRWIAYLGLGFFNRLQAIMFVPILAMVLWRLPDLLSNKGRRAWFLPLACYVAVAVIGIPFAVNHGVARIATKLLVLYFSLGVATFLYLNTPQRVVRLLYIFLGQFIWWAFHSGFHGIVPWHPEFANSDGFGPLALIGLAVTFYFGLAVKSKKWRYFAWLLTCWAVVSIVASFARGVVLSLILLAGMMWLRSPRKGRMSLIMAGGLVLIVVGAEVLVPNESTGNEIIDRDRPHGGIRGFYTEMMSSFSEGKSEGTGNDRWELWKASWLVFTTHPIVGAGAQNVGIAASEMLQVGEIGSNYANNPRTLWGRQLHNIYFQILSEFGILGTIAYLSIIIDFWKKNARLRRRDRGAYWNVVTGGEFNLYNIAMGLEMAMVAFLATGFFYNTLYLIWFFALCYINRLVYFHSTLPPLPPQVPGGRRMMPA